MESVIQHYWNKQPCNINHSQKEMYTKEYFDEVEKKKYFVEPHIPEFADFTKYKNKKVLEIGTGIGTDAVNFARHGAYYTGVELSDVSLEITKKRFEIYGIQGTFYNINAEYLMDILEQESFDLIYSFGVIHHAEFPEKIIENCYKLLKPIGELKIMMYATNSWKKIRIDNNLDQYEAQTGCPVAYTYTDNEIKNLLKNFKKIEIKQTHIFPYKINEYKNNIYEKEEYFKTMPDNLFNALENNLGWHLCIKCNK